MALPLSRDWVTQLPKAELHAHLNGSIRDSTILDLAERMGLQEDAQRILDARRSGCWEIFQMIYKLTTTAAVAERIAEEAVEDFAADGCRYVEIRTTPRAEPSTGMTQRAYVEAVLAGLQKGAASTGVRTGLLLSVSRKFDEQSAMSAQAADDVVDLAIEFRTRGVVGVELSGNPSVGTFATWRPALERARRNGLPVSLHFAEVANEAESLEMLDFGPERIGHACYLTDVLRARLAATPVPLEACLTSNLYTASVPSLAEHHAKDLIKARYPVALCTDDRGVFRTSLVDEYMLAIEHLGLDEADVRHVAQVSMDCAFG